MYYLNFLIPNNQSFFPQFFSVWGVEKENKLFIGAKLRKKTVLDQWKVCFLFQLLKLRKIWWKFFGKTRLVVCWFDVTNKIYILCFKNNNVFCKLFALHYYFFPPSRFNVFESNLCHFDMLRVQISSVVRKASYLP